MFHLKNFMVIREVKTIVKKVLFLNVNNKRVKPSLLILKTIIRFFSLKMFTYLIY